ncbi:MAG: hypothetical protein KC444_09980 [Nitrosopumilus sp.]|nr:hypothetical protein [Nitrosopumilus sp.]
MKAGILIMLAIGMMWVVIIPYSYASCTAPLLGPPRPCFDSFTVSADGPLTERSIMENYARNIERNYGDWQMSDRDWDDEDEALQLPAIICTEFVTDGAKQYRMAKWVDLYTISSFENHRDDSLCDKWLAPIDDGVKITWDRSHYSSNDAGIVQAIDKDMNFDDKKLDSFDIHVWSDTDHDGIELAITETDVDSGIFEGSVFFTTENESGSTTLLVEDAVYAEHKSNVGSARIINEPEHVEPTEEVLEDAFIECVEGYKQVDSQCVPDDVLMISYGHQWALKIILIILVLITMSVGIILGLKIWRKRK